MCSCFRNKQNTCIFCQQRPPRRQARGSVPEEVLSRHAQAERQNAAGDQELARAAQAHIRLWAQGRGNNGYYSLRSVDWTSPQDSNLMSAICLPHCLHRGTTLFESSEKTWKGAIVWKQRNDRRLLKYFVLLLFQMERNWREIMSREYSFQRLFKEVSYFLQTFRSLRATVYL